MALGTRTAKGAGKPQKSWVVVGLVVRLSLCFSNAGRGLEWGGQQTGCFRDGIKEKREATWENVSLGTGQPALVGPFGQRKDQELKTDIFFTQSRVSDTPDGYDGGSYNGIMKVTAIIPDNLVEEVRFYSKGKNITESMIIALNEWLGLKHLHDLNNQVEDTSLHFEIDASDIRGINRL